MRIIKSLLLILTIFAFAVSARIKSFDQEEVMFGESDLLSRIIYFDFEADPDYGNIAFTTPGGAFNFSHRVIVDGGIVASSTGEASRPCPRMTESQRDAISADEGDCVVNSSTDELNYYLGGAWGQVGGGGSGSGVSTWTANGSYLKDTLVIEPINQQLLQATDDVTSTGTIDYANWFVIGPQIKGVAGQINVTSIDGIHTLGFSNYIDLTEQGSFTNPPTGQSRLGFKTDGNLYSRDSGGVESVFSKGTLTADVCTIRDIKGDGVEGGVYTANTIVTRDLNTLSGTCGHVELNNSAFTLTPSGSFYIEADVPCFDTAYSKAFFFNTTTATVTGTFDYSGSFLCGSQPGQIGTVDAGAVLEASTSLTIASPNVLEVHFSGSANDGGSVRALGTADFGGFATTGTGSFEGFTEVRVWKLSP